MGLGFHYCKECKDNLERQELGYSPLPSKCNKVTCRIIDILNIMFVILLSGVLILFLLPIIIILVIIDFIRSD